MRRRELLGLLALTPLPLYAAALPAPKHGQRGVVRMTGGAALADVAAAWKNGFEAQNPDIRVDISMTGSDVAMASLYTANCDIALIGREATKPEIQAFEWIYRFRPTGVPVLTGSIATPGCSPALAVLVHKSNPLARIDSAGLKAAFGEHVKSAGNWGELGLEGKWQDKPISIYAPEAESGTGRFFRAKILNDSNRMMWSRLREFAAPAHLANSDEKAAKALRSALARDPLGLAIGVALKDNASIRTVPLVGLDGLARLPDAASLSSGSYPLARTVAAYFAQPNAGAAHAETLALLRFMASSEGQALAAGAGVYLPLPPSAAAASRAALG